MSDIGRRLRIIRLQRRLSLRQVENLTVAIAEAYGDVSRRISASWLGRLEREQHSIPHKTFETLKEVYKASEEELLDTFSFAPEVSFIAQAQLPNIPAPILKALVNPTGEYLLPPESWFAYFPETILLPSSVTRMSSNKSGGGRKQRRPDLLYGVLGANDLTLLGVVHPGSIVEIDSTIRGIDSSKVYQSTTERPIYFLRSHEGFHCGWCQLDSLHRRLTLVPSILGKLSQKSWRYRDEVEVVGLVYRVLTRLRFARNIGHDHMNRDEFSNTS